MNSMEAWPSREVLIEAILKFLAPQDGGVCSRRPEIR